MIEGYVTVNELAKHWDMAPRTIQTMCADTWCRQKKGNEGKK